MQLRRPRSDTFGIAELVEKAERGSVRIPEFQRPFVWDDSDILSLFDSIWRGFPVGTLLFWQRETDAGTAVFGPLSVESTDTGEALWVVDGQQRLTTLVATLSKLVSSGSDPRFEVCFDLRRLKFVHAKKRPRPAWWLPLRVTLESRQLLGWIREDGTDLSPDELDRADELAGTLRDYRIPAYLVEHDDEQLLRDVFDRVNSAGKPISRSQVFHALFGGFADAGSALQVVESLERRGFGSFEDQRVVQSLLAIRGGDIQRDIHDEFEAGADRSDWLDQTEQALVRAIEFLRAQDVPHLLLMPQTLPLPVLASFFHLHPDPDPWVERLLGRWLWRGWVHGFGRSGQTPALRQAVRAVHPKKGDASAAPSEYAAVKALLDLVPDDDVPDDFVESFRTNRASGRLILLALAKLHPLTSDHEAYSVANALDEHGGDAITEFVQDKRSMAAARGFWPVGQLPPRGDESPAVLRSHAIEDEAAAALLVDDHETFLKLRGLSIHQTTQGFLRNKVEARTLIRPPLEQLFVPED